MVNQVALNLLFCKYSSLGRTPNSVARCVCDDSNDSYIIVTQCYYCSVGTRVPLTIKHYSTDDQWEQTRK